MKLNDFLIERDLSMAAFARLVGTTAATISRVADGSVMPRRPLLLRIHEATGGLVTANDLTGTYCTLACPAVAGPSKAKQIEEPEENSPDGTS